MKKRVFILSTLFISINSFAQNYESKEYPCKLGDIQIVDDVFTGGISYRSQIIKVNKGNEYPQFMLFKDSIKGKIVNTLLISVLGSSLEVNENGATFLFANGEKILRQNTKIKVDPGNSSSWEYSTQITLTNYEFQLFKTQPLNVVKLYIYEDFLSEDLQIELQKFFTCMEERKFKWLLDALLSAILIIQTKVFLDTLDNYTEVIFKSRSGFEAGCYNDIKKKTWQTFIQVVSYSDKSTVFMEPTDFLKLGGYIQTVISMMNK